MKTHNVAGLLESAAKKHPNKAAIVGSSLSGKCVAMPYKELESLACSYAKAFHDEGLKAGDLVVLLVPLSVEMYACIAGLFKLGAVPVLYENKEIRSQLKITLDSIKPSAVIASPEANLLLSFIPEYRGIKKRLLIRGWQLSFGAKTLHIGQGVKFASKSLLPDAPALLTFTSGSEGIPKGIMRTHGFLYAQHRTLKRELNLKGTNVVMTTWPVFIMHLIAGGYTAVVPPLKGNLPWNPAQGVRLIKSNNVDTLMGASSFLSALINDRSERQVKAVKTVWVGGCFLEKELICRLKQKFPDAKVKVIYGSTEVEPVSIASEEDIMESDSYGDSGYCVGKPVRGIKAKIVKFKKGRMTKDDFVIRKNGEIGELIVAGKAVNGKYLPREPSWSMNKVIAWDNNGAVWHRMGDGAYFDNRGRIWLVGRFKLLSRRVLDNFNAYLRMQTALRRTANVGKVVMVESKNGKDILIAESGALFRGRLRKKVMDTCRIHGFSPDKIVFLNKIPLDGRHNSKIDYSRLRG